MNQSGSPPREPVKGLLRNEVPVLADSTYWQHRNLRISYNRFVQQS